MKRMTFTKQIFASLVFSAIAVSSVHAQETLIQGWSGTATLGANSISGNSEANSINAGIRLGKTVGKWEHLVFGSLFKGDSTVLIDQVDVAGLPVTQTLENGDIVTLQRAISSGNSNRLAIGYQPRFYWRPRTYFFGIVDYEKDEPANLELSSRQLIGVGHKFFSNASGFLSGEAGVGNKTTQAVFGEDVSGGAAYLGLNYLNRVNDNVTFNADFRADIGSDNTFTEIGLGVAFKVSEKMAVKITHQTRGNTDLENPALPSASASDNATSINLVVDI